MDQQQQQQQLGTPMGNGFNDGSSGYNNTQQQQQQQYQYQQYQQYQQQQQWMMEQQQMAANAGFSNNNGMYYSAQNEVFQRLQEMAKQQENGETSEIAPQQQQQQQISHEHDTVVTKVLNLKWIGTLDQFAEEGAAVKWQAKPLIKTNSSNKFILIKQELTRIQNTLPVGVSILLENIPVNVETIGNGTQMAHFVIPAHTVQPLSFAPDARILYQRGKNSNIDRNTLIGWSRHTPETLDKTIIEKGSHFWTLTSDSPILAIATNNTTRWRVNDDTLFGHPLVGTKLDAGIASACYEFAREVLDDLPFQDLSKIAATIYREDGEKFNSLKGIVDSSPMSSFKESNAKGELNTITAQLKQTFIVWRSDIPASTTYDDQ